MQVRHLAVVHQVLCLVLQVQVIFLTRTSAILATGFFVIALVLGNINSHRGNVQKGSFDDLSQTAEQVQQQQQQAAPAVENKK